MEVMGTDVLLTGASLIKATNAARPNAPAHIEATPQQHMGVAHFGHLAPYGAMPVAAENRPHCQPIPMPNR
jgi:hypothetical protein